MACLACQSKIGKSKKHARVAGAMMMDDITKGALGLASTGVGLVAAYEATEAINNSSFKTENPDIVKYGVPIVGVALGVGLPMLFEHGSEERALAENFSYAFGGYSLFNLYKNWRQTAATDTPAVTGWDNQAYALKGADNRSYALAKAKGVKGAVPNPKAPTSWMGMGATLPRPKAPAGMGF